VSYLSVWELYVLDLDWSRIEVPILLVGGTLHHYTVGGLSPYTVYDLRMRAVISEGGMQVLGEFSGSQSFTTLPSSEC